MTYNDAIMFCSDNFYTIASINVYNKHEFLRIKEDKDVWIIMIDGVFYNNECMFFSKKLHQSKNCSDLHFASCTKPNTF